MRMKKKMRASEQERQKERQKGGEKHTYKSDHEVMNAKWFSFHAKHKLLRLKSWPLNNSVEMIYVPSELFDVVTLDARTVRTFSLSIKMKYL